MLSLSKRLFLSAAQQTPDEARGLAHVLRGDGSLEFFLSERFHVGAEYRVGCGTLDRERDRRAADGRQQPGGMDGGTHFEIENMGRAGRAAALKGADGGDDELQVVGGNAFGRRATRAPRVCISVSGPPFIQANFSIAAIFLPMSKWASLVLSSDMSRWSPGVPGGPGGQA